MSKTPEQYVEYALKHFSEHHKTAGRIVQELRAAGWLREANEIPALVALEGYKRLLAEKERELCPGCYDRVTELTRERDEARVDREAWARAYRRALATAASPEVMRVLDALEEHKERYPRNYSEPWRDPETKGSWYAIAAAYNALSASRQPKAQEPRWTTERRPGWSNTSPFHWWANKGDEWIGPMSADAAHDVCKRLNGEGGGR